MGTAKMPFGWEDGAKEYIANLVNQYNDISAKELAHKIVNQAEKNDGYSLKDDTSCCVIYMRKPRNLLVCTGPHMTRRTINTWPTGFGNFKGKKSCVGEPQQPLSPVNWVRKWWST